MLQLPLSVSSLCASLSRVVPAERAQTRRLSWHSPVCLWAWGLASRKLSKVHSHAQCGNPTCKPRPWTLHRSFSAKTAIDEMSSGRPGDEGQLFSVVRDAHVGFFTYFYDYKETHETSMSYLTIPSRRKPLATCDCLDLILSHTTHI